jgi:hypothetical protein
MKDRKRAFSMLSGRGSFKHVGGDAAVFMAVVGASGGPAGRRRHPSNISFVDIHGNPADSGIKGGIESGVKSGSLVDRWFFTASDAGEIRRWRK